jgi:hypothetical protein
LTFNAAIASLLIKGAHRHFTFSFSTIANRLCSELNRLVRETVLEQDVLKDFQAKLDLAEYVLNKILRNDFIIIFSILRIDRTKAIIERVRYNNEDNVLKEKELILIEQKRTVAQLRQRQEDWKVTQMKRAHLSALQYVK